MKTESHAIFKFNGGLGALLCSGCAKIMKTGKDYTPLERAASAGDVYLEPQYCEKCQNRIKDQTKAL